MDDNTTDNQRRKAIAWAVALTTGTELEAQQYERELLECYAVGKLSLQEVLHRLDNRIHHLIYHSQATQECTPYLLTDLLEEARAYNQIHNITGLLCYNAGHFVQLLEGEAIEIQRLYSHIKQDSRHQNVITLREGAGPLRLFPDWSMAYAIASTDEFYWLLSYMQTREYQLLKPQIPISNGHLLTLL